MTPHLFRNSLIASLAGLCVVSGVQAKPPAASEGRQTNVQQTRLGALQLENGYPDKGAGGKYLILPPGMADPVAPGYRIVRATSNQIWFGTRGLDPDKAVAEATVRRHRLYGWNQRNNPPTNAYIPVRAATGNRPSPPTPPTGVCSASSMPTNLSRPATA